MKTLCVILLFYFHFTSAANASPLCSDVIISGDLNPGLDDVEKGLVCGEKPENSSHTGRAWTKIPYWQSEYFLTNFLQKRGYLHPRFSKISESNMQEVMKVDVGEMSRVTRISIVHEGLRFDPQVNLKMSRQIIGQPLSPASLDSIEKWISEKLKNQGYACPIVTSNADADTGEVTVKVDTGPLLNFSEVTTEPIPGLQSENGQSILRRYDAFELGSIYDESLLTITSQRVTSRGIVESSHFRSTCRPDGVHLMQEVLPGRPRLLTVGVGVNTEGLLLGKLVWKNTRLGRRASLMDISASGSAKLQTLQAALNWYFLPDVSRFYLFPLVQLDHDNEQHFEAINLKNQIGLAGTWDRGPLGAAWFIGPSLNFYRTLSGFGAPEAHFLLFESRMVLKSHSSEYFFADPRGGFTLSGFAEFSHKNLGSCATVQKLGISGEILWNISQLEPPLWIVGLRGGGSTLLTDETLSPATLLPASFLQYLGGSSNLRGFGRQELPLANGGGLTSGFLGWEVRLSHTLPFSLDPFIFFDVGAIGRHPFSWELPLYWSPGFGLRWASPVGSFRTTLAHGYSGSEPNHWQFYFSLGEEF